MKAHTIMNQSDFSRPPVYTKYFEFFRVDGYDLLDTAFALRYQVYCEERGFLDPARYPAHIERDVYDETAVHFIGRHRLRCMAAGTARLVLSSHQGFPLQAHCDFNREFSFVRKPGHPALRDYAEISRLAVSKFFRQRADDSVYGGPSRPGTVSEGASAAAGLGLSPEEAGPEIVAGLFKSMYHEIKRLGVTHVIVAMERSLHLLLRRLGYQFRAMGPVVDYYGPVIPYIARIGDLEHHLYVRRRAVFDYWMEGLEPQYLPALPLRGAPVRVPPRAIVVTPGKRRQSAPDAKERE